jgi:hypothetical protein
MEDLKLNSTQTQNLTFVKVFMAGLAILLSLQISLSFQTKSTDIQEETCQLKKNQKEIQTTKRRV